MNFNKKIGKILTSKSVGTGPSSYEKRIYRAAVSQKLRNADAQKIKTHILCSIIFFFSEIVPFMR